MEFFMQKNDKNLQEEGKTPKIVRGALQVIGGAVPFAGGFFLQRRERGQKMSGEKSNQK